MRRTFRTKVRDKAGTLNRLTSIFVRRQFNIVTLSATPTLEDGVSDITFVAEVPDTDVLRNLIQQLEKQINIIHVEDITDTNTYNRELVLVKLQTPSNNAQLEKVIKPYDALISILKKEDDYTYLQASGPQYTMDNLLDDLSSYGIAQVSRTGSAGII
ncbi:acetolactate synthase small subunit [Staphylococcus gallinarum]|jgi:acetolactate synthase-1/3 small subunit|uniref:acetolactate synthase small subunit n=1 Tax=Staphylococcus gallinarum TaxID=1293 RepID=UPI000D1C9DC3|nr:acetolactate synthase small subunit [Staphylococcus gallinarum]MBU7217524.1 acetolactate synthase small subunit [Staphylococcus gallinarum]MCD8787084.1 acetolactate synthase small subunit [Staphylococcus gallinarum]MCD8794208.1 acetolactate synthase small subunit [Staphylococcus gallinarum]MCD8822095.1 acetolactate synthase small subunit [Staphylococcus gallinarum]MCD8830095.1 acetolactate synthase small subunit [Staphylococcus gallinarum]